MTFKALGVSCGAYTGRYYRAAAAFLVLVCLSLRSLTPILDASVFEDIETPIRGTPAILSTQQFYQAMVHSVGVCAMVSTSSLTHPL